MDADASATADHRQPHERRRRLLRMAGLAVAAILILAAVAFVLSHRDELDGAARALRTPDPLTLLALAGAIVGNVVLTGLMYSVLISRYGRVGFLEMQALIAATTLINYLPARPGLFGRVAYHKSVNRIDVRDSARVVVTAIILSVVTGGLAVMSILVAVSAGWSLGWVYGAVIVLTVAFGLGFPPVSGRRSQRRQGWDVQGMVLGVTPALVLRELDVLVWAGRYAAVFALVGRPISFEAALALACVSMLATMVPLISNGLGLREWAIGLAAPLLAVGVDSPLAIAADLVNRAAEMIVVVVLGLLGVAYIAARRRKGPATIRND